MTLTVTDLFCGAGGSSSGAEAVPGVRVRLAANHWQLAIDTHNLNMPHVDHDREDIARVDPRRYPRTDLLWASPSCTFWSQARGERQDFTAAATEPTLFDLDLLDDADDEPASAESKERSRALMHDVPRFAEHHRYKAVIVENTPELLKWWHLPKWIARMRALGYVHQVLTVNSAFAQQLGAPAPQLRDRVYVVFWQDRYPAPDFERWTRPPAWCPSCDEVVTALRAPKDPRKPHGAYRRQYVFRCPSRSCRHAEAHPYVLPAAAAVDWLVRGQRIGDRAKPLAPKTVARIEAGLRRYARRPVVLEAAGNTFERRPGVRAWPVDEPLRTLHTTASKALACPPFLTVLRTHGGNTAVDQPMRTVVAGTTAQALLVPVEGRDNIVAHPVDRPLRVQTGRCETGLLVPAGGTWNEDATSTGEPMRTRTSRESEALVIPLRGTNRPKRIVDPLDTIAARGQHHGLLMRNNTPRGDAGQMCTPTDEPMRTLTTAGHQSLIWSPDLLYAYDTGALRSVGEPLATQTTVEGDALLESGLTVEDCLFRMLMPDEIKLGMAL